MTDATPAPDPSTPAPAEAVATGATAPAPARRPVRAWDIVLTIVLLLLGAVVAVVGSFLGFFLAFASDSCGASSVCNTDQIGTGMIVAIGGVWVPIAIALIASVVLLILRRRAWWVALLGVVATAGVFVLGAAIVFSAVQPA